MGIPQEEVNKCSLKSNRMSCLECKNLLNGTLSTFYMAYEDMYAMIDDLVVNFEWESLKLKCCSFFEIESQAATRKFPHKQKFKNYMYI